MNVLANIAPAYQFLGAFLPWQLLAIIPVIIGADIAIRRAGPRTGMIIAGAIIGITFYIFNYPMLPMAFAELLNQPNLSIDAYFAKHVCQSLAGHCYDSCPKRLCWYSRMNHLARRRYNCHTWMWQYQDRVRER